MIRTSLVRALSARDHSTMTAPNAWEGLQSLVAHQPDVVLLDLGLPDLDGASLLAMIRAVSQVPVIVVSARDDDAGIVALLDAGADDYLVKPFAADPPAPPACCASWASTSAWDTRPAVWALRSRPTEVTAHHATVAASTVASSQATARTSRDRGCAVRAGVDAGVLTPASCPRGRARPSTSG